MRKKTVDHCADTLFWYLLYLFPVLGYMLYLFVEPGTGATLLSFETFCSNIGVSFFTDNIVLSSLTSIFGVEGVLPLFNSSAPFIMFTWFVCVFIAHLAVDFLLFIPRLAHKWLRGFYDGGKF